MKQRPRIYYSASQSALIRDSWRKGDTLHQIAGLFDRYHSSIHRILAESGGIRPAERHRSRSALPLTERGIDLTSSVCGARSYAGRVQRKSSARPRMTARFHPLLGTHSQLGPTGVRTFGSYVLCLCGRYFSAHMITCKLVGNSRQSRASASAARIDRFGIAGSLRGMAPTDASLLALGAGL
jgi:hypothetical protein